MKRLVMALASIALVGAAPDPLANWTPAERAAIDTTLSHVLPGDYATFDADNTLWVSDLEESLLPWLENHGFLHADRLDPMLKPVPMLPGESLYGYYHRLCEVDDNLCYPWIAQAFSGLSLKLLKQQVDAMIADGRPIPVRYRVGDREVAGTVMPPRIMPGQRQLLAALRARGVRIYVVTASLEELVRMVVSDPRYGLDVPPDRVIGVTMLLRDPKTGAVTTARQQIAKGHFLDGVYSAEHHADMVLTPTLWAPLTWHEGKVAAIRTYIDPVRHPLLAAGDSASDWPMLFYADGLRIWVERRATPNTALLARRHFMADGSHGRESGTGAFDQHWISPFQSDLARGD